MDENLKPGRIVHYVLKNGDVRPFTITRVSSGTKNINGVLAFDGPNDKNQLPEDLEISSTAELRAGTRWLEDVPYDEMKTGKNPTPGTWHWPLIAGAAAAR
jgi:hypothetical protein